MRFIVAEDHALFREVLSKTIHELGHTVVAAVDTVGAALRECAHLQPEVVALDLRLRDGPAGPLLEYFRRLQRPPSLILFSGNLSGYLVHWLEQLPTIASYVDKREASVPAIRQAVSATCDGRQWLSLAYINVRSQLRANPLSFEKVLSDREELFLRFAVADLTDEEIASRMNISVRTAEGYRSSVIKKLQVGNSVRLAAFAREHGFDLFPVECTDTISGSADQSSREMNDTGPRLQRDVR